MNWTHRKRSLLAAVAVFLSVFLSTQARAEEADLTYSLSFTDQELDELIAPIALYPDPLLAQMLPAATYPDEVADAAAWLDNGGDVSDIDEQNWEESVKAIVHYPDILHMMAGSMDWTANLGDAFLNQPEDVTSSIQRLRWQARAVGNLVSNSEQTIIIEGDYIQIVPAQPQYVYVPRYDPSVIYVEEFGPGGPPFITFGLGLAIGDWLSMDFDWGHHHVIYHGWNRPGWVNHARPYVHVRNVYINQSRPSIQQTWRHDRSHGDPARYLSLRPGGPKIDQYTRAGEVRGQTAVQPGPAGGTFGPGGDTRVFSNRGRESRGVVGKQPAPLTSGINRRTTIPAPKVSQPATIFPNVSERRNVPTPSVNRRTTIPVPKVSQPATISPSVSERSNVPIPSVSRRPSIPAPAVTQRPTPVVPQASSSPSRQPSPAREGLQPNRTPSVTFGGYRGADEARAQSVRGEASRQGTERARPSAPPVSQGRAPAGGKSSGERQRRGR